MPLTAGEFHIEVHGIFVDPFVLGRTLTVLRDEVKFEILLPRAPDSFRFMQFGPSLADPRDYDTSVALVETDGSPELRLVKVTATVISDLSLDTFSTDDPTQWESYRTLAWDLASRSVDLVAEVCDRLRIELDQYWIEPRGRYPRIVGMIGLVDQDKGRAFERWMVPPYLFRILHDAIPLDDAHLQWLQSSLDAGPPKADALLLAEAKYLLQSEQPTGLDRSTLLAAIAIELRTKRLLRDLATPDRLGMLDLLIDNPSDWSMAAHGLFAKAIPVFRKHHDLAPDFKLLAKKVQKLFESRNKIVHRGVPVSKDDATTHVETAVAAFELMDRLSPLPEPLSS